MGKSSTVQEGFDAAIRQAQVSTNDAMSKIIPNNATSNSKENAGSSTIWSNAPDLQNPYKEPLIVNEAPVIGVVVPNDYLQRVTHIEKPKTRDIIFDMSANYLSGKGVQLSSNEATIAKELNEAFEPANATKANNTLVTLQNLLGGQNGRY